MLLAFFVLLTVTLGGSAITYLYQKNAPLVARLAAGAVLGQVVLGLTSFVVASFVGMSEFTIFAAVAVSAAPLILLRDKEIKRHFSADLTAFKQKLRDFFWRPKFGDTLLSLCYLALVVLLWFFFERAMLVYPDGGVGVGSPNNVGDLPFHLQGIYGFTDGQNFPPQNPSFAGSKFTYPFVVNMALAVLIKSGAAVRDAIFWQNLVLVCALVRLLHYFAFKLTNNRVAAHIAPFLFLLGGGFGFVLFFKDAAASEAGVFGSLLNLQNEYTLRFESTWRWGNPLTVLFITQRSLLLGLPLALIVLASVWNFFFERKKDDARSGAVAAENKKSGFNLSAVSIPIVVTGLIAGSLPLVHAHTFAVVMGMTGCMALMDWRDWREWAQFFAAAALVAVPEVLWMFLGTANNAQNFVGWHFGWDHGKENIAWFWLKNTGLFVPLLLIAVGWLIYKIREPRNREPEIENQATEPPDDLPATDYKKLLLFWLPFVLCFAVSNCLKLAPWVWDNIKVLVYWHVASVPLVALVLAQIWRRGRGGQIAAFALLVGLTLAGWLDVWRVASRQHDYRTFDPDAVKIARLIREKTAPDSLIMSAPAFNSPVVMTGRRWFLGFTGHLWSHGINPTEREEQVKRIYAGTPDALDLLRKNRIEYVLLSPLERESLAIDESFFAQFPIIAQAGNYRVYQIKN